MSAFDPERLKDSSHVGAYRDPRIEAAIKELQAAIIEAVRKQMLKNEEKDIRTVLLNMSEATLSVVAQICQQTIDSHVYAITEMEKVMRIEKGASGV